MASKSDEMITVSTPPDH